MDLEIFREIGLLGTVAYVAFLFFKAYTKQLMEQNDKFTSHFLETNKQLLDTNKQIHDDSKEELKKVTEELKLIRAILDERKEKL